MRPALLVALACSLGCVSAKAFKQTTQVYLPTQKDAVLVFTDAAEVGRPYEILGTIYSEGSSGWGKNEHDLVDKMRGKAALLGGDAIIVNEFDRKVTTAARVSAAVLGTNDQKLQAVAIKFVAAHASSEPLLPVRNEDAAGGVRSGSIGHAGDETSREPKPVTNEDVLKLVAGGVGDEVVLAAINRGPTSFALDTESILQLRKGGVSETVLKAMLESTK